MISEITCTPISVASVSASQHQMPPGFPWGMLHSFAPKGYQPTIKVLISQPIMSILPPVVHATPYVEETIFHVDQSESVGVYERMDEFQDQFQAMQKEIKALRGK